MAAGPIITKGVAEVAKKSLSSNATKVIATAIVTVPAVIWAGCRGAAKIIRAKQGKK